MSKREHQGAVQVPVQPTVQSLAITVVLRRAELGMTQLMLAKKAGVAHRTIQNIEAGRNPSPIVLASVARALGMSTAELKHHADSAAAARAAS